jgi:glycosyltransferase involved in cell wall biosynthesis
VEPLRACNLSGGSVDDGPMIDRTPTPGMPMPPGPSLLYVATVTDTIRHFLTPYAAHFRALGWRVGAAANGASTDTVLREAFDDVYELPLSRSILDLQSLVRGERAISEVLASQPDIVHVHTPIASFLTRLAARSLPETKRPAVAYTAHGFHFYQGGCAATNAVFLTAERVAGRWTDRLVVMNDEDYEAARRNRIIGPGRLVRMPGIGVDTEWYSRSRVDPDEITRARRELRVGPETPLFVAVGELSRRKRMADVVEALALMRHHEAALALAGEGAERQRLEVLAAERGVRNRVHFAGSVADVRPMVGGATALVLASDREGLARAIMEALALEVPVIASTARGNRELVDTDGGFIFPIGDVDHLAAKMDWLVDHPAEGLEMGRCGRERMVERYDLRSLVRLHEDMYRGMLAVRGKRSR